MVALAPASQACAHIGRDQVVGLEAGLLQARDVEGAHRFADQRELRDAGRPARPAGAPCSPDTARCGTSSPTCRSTTARWVGLSSGFMSRRSFHSMLQKPSTGVDLQAVGLAGQRRQRVVGAEDVARAVDQKDVVALLAPGLLPPARLAAGFAAGSDAAFAGWRGLPGGDRGMTAFGFLAPVAMPEGAVGHPDMRERPAESIPPAAAPRPWAA